MIETLYFTYGETSIDDCEDAWTDASGGNVTPSTSTSDYQEGTKSSLLTTTGSISSGNIAYFNTGTKDISAATRIGLWIKPSFTINADHVALKLSNSTALGGTPVSLTLPSCVSGRWTYVLLSGTLSSLNSLDSVGLGALDPVGSGQTIYIDDIRAFTGYQAVTCLSVRGLDEPGESIVNYPAIKRVFLDGTEEEVLVTFKRAISVATRAITTKSERLFIHNWLRASDKRIASTYDSLYVVSDDVESFSNIWLGNFIGARAFQLSLVEKNARTTNPTSWSY